MMTNSEDESDAGRKPQTPQENYDENWDWNETEEDEIEDVITTPQQFEAEKEEHDSIQVGAGIAAGVGGLLFGGPIIGLVLGFGAAHVTRKEGAGGDIARAVGEVALTVKEKAQKVDDKHKFVERSTNTANRVWESAQEYDQDFNILEKTKNGVETGWNSTVDFVKRNRLIERGVDGVGQATDWATQNVEQATDWAAEKLSSSTPAEPITTNELSLSENDETLAM